MISPRILFILGSLFLAYDVGQADIVFREEPSDTVVVKGHPLSFHCLVEDDEDRGSIVVQWLHNSVQLQINSIARLNLLPNGTLYITSTQSGDEGLYSCLASVIGSQGIVEQQRSVAATLSFAYIESIFYHPPNSTVTDQQPTPAYFQCISGDSLPKAVITWEKEGRLLTPQYASQYSTMFGGTGSHKTSGTLQIDNVRMRHAGRYRCITTNPLLPGRVKYSNYATLTVFPNPGQPYVSQAPSSQIIPLGDPASFVCEILGDPVPVISWFRDGEALGSSDDGRIQAHPNGTLAFTSVTEADEGAYVCNGTNQLGSVITDEVTLLTAYIDWTFLQEPEDLTVVEGQDATLVCRPPNSKPAANITWYKDNQLLAPRSGTAILGAGDLFFSSTIQADEGGYFCVATNDYVPASQTSKAARLEIKVGARLTNPPSNTEVVLEDDLTLTCEAEGDPTPTLRWLMSNRELTEGGRVTLGNSGGLLHITGMTSLDRGTYTCTASNEYGTDRESVYVNVLVPPRLLQVPPSSLSTGLGTSILIPCYVVGEPVPEVLWFKDGILLTFDPPAGHYQKTNEGLYIAEVDLSDSGVYLCRAENKVDHLEVNIALTVETPPVFVQVPQNQTVSEEAVVFFECQAEGVPPPTLSWSFNGGPSLSLLSLSSDHQRLTIPSATIALDGVYTCIAENTQGSIMSSAYLNIRTAPVLEPITNVTADTGAMITVTCEALFGFPDIDFSWLRGTNILTAGDGVRFPEDGKLEMSIRGSDEGWYTCVATNDLGSSRESFYISVLDIPGMPTILEVLALSETSIEVTWVAGEDTEDTESYQVQYRLSSDSEWTVHLILVTSNGNESFVIEELSENREYEIRIVASNRLGDSEPSTTVIAYTLSLSGPSVPRNLHVVASNSTSIQLEWEIPEERRGPIAVYHINYNKEGDNTSTTVELLGEGLFTVSYTIGDLRPNSRYYFQVCAATSFEGEIQQGNCTHHQHHMTATAAPDIAPSDVTLVPLSSSSISVSWSPIPEYYQNGEILGYNISYESVSGGPVTVVPVTAPMTSHIIEYLDPWTEYSVSIAAYNVDGLSPASDVQTVMTLPAAPSISPAIVSNKTLNTTAIFISWQLVEEAAGRNGPIDGYIVTWQEEGATNTSTFNESTEQNHFTITGLSVGSIYEVTVIAYNTVDNVTLSGPPSSTLVVSTADGVPSQISDPVIQSGSNFIFMKWSPPIEYRGTITGYQIQYAALREKIKYDAGINSRARREVYAGSNETHGTAYSKAAEYNLTGLAQDTNYSITIMAETSAGLGEGLSFFTTTDASEIPKSTPRPSITTDVPQSYLEKESWRLLGLPFNSFIIFTSSVGLAFVFFLLAVFLVTAWCSRASGKRHAKRRLVNRSLLRNDQFVQISPPSTDEGVDNCSRSESSPTPSSLIAAPTSSQALDDNDMIENRPRASSSPASAQLAIKPGSSRYVNGVSHYGTNPRQDKSMSVKSLDGSPNQLEDLYAKVNRTSRGPGRFQKDSLAAIAALLDQEESDHEGGPPDSPPSVVIADQRTVL